MYDRSYLLVTSSLILIQMHGVLRVNSGTGERISRVLEGPNGLKLKLNSMFFVWGGYFLDFAS